MGTNFYAEMPGCKEACKHCSEVKNIHLGKSSSGWKFIFKADPAWSRPSALDIWINNVMKCTQIKDEYNETWSKTDFLAKVMTKQADRLSSFKPEQEHGTSYRVDPNVQFQLGGFEFDTREFS